MSKYIVESIVCDWAIYSIDNYENKELVEVCNSKVNAELICEILNADLFKDGKYTIWKDQQIADLKAKLAKSEKSKEINIKERDKICLEMATDYNKQILELKQQLEEKEKEETKRMEDFEKGCQEYYNSDEYKRDFAIAELEKVKELININGYGDNQGNVSWLSIEEIIDQQIKSLKGEE